MTDRNGSLLIESAGEFLKIQFPVREALLSPWFLQRQNSLLYAPSGIGKSFLAWSIALTVAGSGPLGQWNAPTPRRVLFVDAEMDEVDLQTRLSGLLTASPGTDEKAVKRNLMLLARQRQKPDADFPDLNKREWREWLLGRARTEEVELVVLDNFSTLCEVDDENQASSFNGVQSFLIALKQSNISGLLVHHTRKGGKEKDSYRGTSKMGVVFDTIIRLDDPPETQKPSDGSAAFKLTFEKTRAQRDRTMEPTVMALHAFGWSVLGDEEGELERLVRLMRGLKFISGDEAATYFGKKSRSWASDMKRKAEALGLMQEGEWDRLIGKAKECRQADGLPKGDGEETPDF